MTPAGPVQVEDLAPGMLVLAVSGAGAPFQPVAAVRRRRVPGPAIRIRAGTLAEGAPQEDLLLPAAHGLLLDGALVAAEEVVDGYGILREEMLALEVVDIVLDGHDAVLAAGAAVETAPPGPDVPSCAPRRPANGPLKAMLAWRAETLGWAPPSPDAPAPAPAQASLRQRLTASALGPPGPPAPPLRPPR
nr:Hint domain-containing protein [Neoroseomonas soli]